MLRVIDGDVRDKGLDCTCARCSARRIATPPLGVVRTKCLCGNFRAVDIKYDRYFQCGECHGWLTNDEILSLARP